MTPGNADMAVWVGCLVGFLFAVKVVLEIGVAWRHLFHTPTDTVTRADHKELQTYTHNNIHELRDTLNLHGMKISLIERDGLKETVAEQGRELQAVRRRVDQIWYHLRPGLRADEGHPGTEAG